MAAVLLSPFYLLANTYFAYWILKWLGACHSIARTLPARVVLAFCYTLFSSLILIGFFVNKGPFRRILKRWGHYWLGVQLHLGMLILSANLVCLALRFFRGRSLSREELIFVGGLCAAAVIGLCVYGSINARRIRTVRYRVEIPKTARIPSFKLVLAADLHLGANIGCRHTGRMVRAINACGPDLVAIAGDIFDNDYDTLEDEGRLEELLRQIRAPLGTWAVYGNHDIQEKILAGFTFRRKASEGPKEADPRMDAFLRRAGIRLLRDEGVWMEQGFYLFGRADAERPGRGIAARMTPEEIAAQIRRSEKNTARGKAAVIVLDHQPRQLQELAEAGVDLDLCGHTHDGQLFPGNLTTRVMWENSRGYLKKGQMHSIVTSGVGLFGPYMRIGTRPEICEIEVVFTAQASAGTAA